MKTFKTINEKDWAEVFGVELLADETLKNEKGATPAIGNLGVLDDDDYNIEGVCVVDFSGFREYLNKEKPSGSPYFFKSWKR